MQREELAAHGCLLIHDLATGERQMERMCHFLEGEGYPVNVVNLFGYASSGEFDRTPMWQQWLTQAQTAYVDLRRVCQRVTVVGAGEGGVIATVLAEQYSVDGLVVIGSVARPAAALEAIRRRLPFVREPGAREGVRSLDVGRLVRLSENNLFSILADVLVIQAMGDARYSPRGGEVLLGGVRSKRRERVELQGATVRQMCASHAEQIEEALSRFLRGIA